jgi:acylphosphatase
LNPDPVDDLVVCCARVEGRVQGVYFRASTAERARSLGLRGYARNQPDGSVEVLVGGAATAVRQLLDWLWIGPPLARVTAVTVNDADSRELPEGFLSR